MSGKIFYVAQESAMKRASFKSRSHHKEFEVTEQELIQAFDRVLHADHPNPERIGCPGTEVLERVATSLEFSSASILEHLGRCAPCVDELKALRSQKKLARKHSR
jgi:hypothetical protein